MPLEIEVFGATNDELAQVGLEHPWFKNWGVLPRRQVARYLSEVDIFLDYSTYQAMGLTTLEAMASGCIVIGPKNGGTREFVADGINGFLADTTNVKDGVRILQKLIEEQSGWREISVAAIATAHNYFPEKSASTILHALFCCSSEGAESKQPSSRKFDRVENGRSYLRKNNLVEDLQ